MSSTTTATTATPGLVVPDDASGVLLGLRETRARRRAADVDQLLLVLQWARIHAVDPSNDVIDNYGNAPLDIAGVGAPWVAEFCIPELGSVLGMSSDAARALLRDTLDLVYRLPRVWSRVVNNDGTPGKLEVWKARKIASATTHLSAEAAAWVDGQIWWTAHTLSWVQLDRTVADAVGRFMPAEAEQEAERAAETRKVEIYDHEVSFGGTLNVSAVLDVPDGRDLNSALSRRVESRRELGSTEPTDVLRAKALGEMARADLMLDLVTGDRNVAPAGGAGTTLYVHISADDLADAAGDNFGVARVESVGVVTLETVREWLTDPHAQRRVTLKPVIDLNDRVHVTQYEVPDRLREQVQLRDSTCVFPWCNRSACRSDIDHITPYQPDAQPGQFGATETDNLAALCRRHHRLKTHSSWTYTMLEPGAYLWRSPHGYSFLHDHTGTTDVSARPPDNPPDRPSG